MIYPAFFVFVLFCVHQCSSDFLGDEDLEIVEADAEFAVRVVEDIQITGKDCEYIKLCDVIKNSGCEDGKVSVLFHNIENNPILGNKFVIRKKKGTRKQFVILNGSPVLGFVQKKKKFTSCKSYTQITANLKCKV